MWPSQTYNKKLGLPTAKPVELGAIVGPILASIQSAFGHDSGIVKKVLCCRVGSDGSACCSEAHSRHQNVKG